MSRNIEMLKVALNILLLNIVLFFPATLISGDFPAMDPAPADWPDFEYNREPGELKRNRHGLIDPSPDVVSLEYLPKDRYGFVDWARAMSEGIIAPRDSIDGSAPRLKAADREGFDKDILIRSKMDFMPDIIFPHSSHNVWLKCSTCHPRIFKKKAGATPISMSGIWKGKYCGRCHDKVAFPIRNCFKCHSVPRQASSR